jgi:hypothetical protein
MKLLVSLLVAVVFLGAGVPASAQAPNLTPPPGAINPQVTQANIATTICLTGWTRTVRPPVSYTSALKRRQMRDRHLPGRMSDYEEDHYIPLELGGHPTDVRNLWPQPIREARMKDKLESVLNRAVCGGRLTLTQAQRCLVPDWVACARRMRTPAP